MDELRKLATANIALHLMLTKKSEMDFNDKDVLPQEKLSMLLLMIMNHEILGNTDLETINDFVCKKCGVMKVFVADVF